MIDYNGIHFEKKDLAVIIKFIKICQNTPQLCWGDEWLPLSPGGRGLG